MSSQDDTVEVEEISTEEVSDAEVASAPRQARLHVRRIDPWSVMKTTFVLSLGLAIVTVVAMTIVWAVLAALGVFSSVNDAVESVAGSSSSVFNVEDIFSLPRILMGSTIIGLFNVVLYTVLATLLAYMYNLTVPFAKGVIMTLSED